MASYEQNQKILSRIEDKMIDPPDGAEESCEHVWIFIGRHKSGEFYRCRKCHLEEEA